MEEGGLESWRGGTRAMGEGGLEPREYGDYIHGGGD